MLNTYTMRNLFLKVLLFSTVLNLTSFIYWGFSATKINHLFTRANQSSSLFSPNSEKYVEPLLSQTEKEALELLKLRVSIFDLLTSNGEFLAPWDTNYATQNDVLNQLVGIDDIALEMHGLDSMIEDQSIEPALKKMAMAEFKDLAMKLDAETLFLKELLWDLTVPKVSGDIVVEILPAPDKPESPLAIGILQKFYENLAHNNKWNFELISHKEDGKYSGTVVDGAKRMSHAFIRISGPDVFRKLLLEPGVHRLIHTDSQMVGAPFRSNSTHTNYALVRVYVTPKQSAFVFKQEDIEFQFIRSSGAGGQHINKTSSAVRAKHMPSGISLLIQEERDQHQNKRLAIETLKAILFTKHLESQEKELSGLRMESGTSAIAGHSPYVRTYNFKQDPLATERLISGVVPLDTFNDWQRLLDRKLSKMNIELSKEINELTRKLKISGLGELSDLQYKSNDGESPSGNSCDWFLE